MIIRRVNIENYDIPSDSIKEMKPLNNHEVHIHNDALIFSFEYINKVKLRSLLVKYYRPQFVSMQKSPLLTVFKVTIRNTSNTDYTFYNRKALIKDDHKNEYIGHTWLSFKKHYPVRYYSTLRFSSLFFTSLQNLPVNKIYSYKKISGMLKEIINKEKRKSQKSIIIRENSQYTGFLVFNRILESAGKFFLLLDIGHKEKHILVNVHMAQQLGVSF
jgi:hypothetical protein